MSRLPFVHAGKDRQDRVEAALAWPGGLLVLLAPWAPVKLVGWVLLAVWMFFHGAFVWERSRAQVPGSDASRVRRVLKEEVGLTGREVLGPLVYLSAMFAFLAAYLAYLAGTNGYSRDAWQRALGALVLVATSALLFVARRHRRSP